MRERMDAHDLYRVDGELAADLSAATLLMEEANWLPSDSPERREVLGRLLGTLGEGVHVRAPLYVDYGSNLHLGDGTFVNYGLVALDVAEIRVGRDCQIAPGVQILTASHPLDPEPRRAGWEDGQPVTIGDSVWLGAGCLVLPGVTIGDNSVVGAGAVVTKDVPANVVVAGNPARIIRQL